MREREGKSHSGHERDTYPSREAWTARRGFETRQEALITLMHESIMKHGENMLRYADMAIDNENLQELKRVC